ncbi:MAG TPA: YdcF family protein [Ilumatobacter sp.]
MSASDEPGRRRSDDDVAVAESGSDGRFRTAPATWWRRRTRRGRVLVVVAAMLGVVGGYYAVTLFQVVQAGRVQGAPTVDAIVVLGAAQYDGRPSPQLAARLDHVVTLWRDGAAPQVVVTGGKLPGDRFTEAEASRRYLVGRGVPDGAILIENTGTTTYESLAGVAAQLLPAGLDEVLLVTDPYHALRSRLIASEVGMTPAVSPTPTSVVRGWASVRRHLAEAAGVAVGRVIGFERLSDLTG